MKFSLFLFLFLLRLSFSSSSSPNDTNTLTLFRLQVDTHGNLRSNWTGHDACSSTWRGVTCSSNGRVTAVSLPSLSLRGPITSLSLLDQLRILELHHNRLNGTVSPLTNCTNLKHVYLSDNDLSGEIPPEISLLKRLLRLDLSENNIGGNIPREISGLNRLITLRLQNNALTGLIPDFSSSLKNLKELNLTNNEFYGRLPESLLKKFSEQSFTGNEGLCGPSPLPVCSFTGSAPADPSTQTVPSNPSSMPQTPVIGQEDKVKARKGLSPGVIVAIVVAACVVFLVVASFAVAYFCGRNRGDGVSKTGTDSGKRRRSGSSYGSEKKVYASGGGADSDGTTATDRSKLVFFERRKQFELEDLLRASAEMLGKGSLGTVYKAVLDDGCTVAVKRLKDANPCPRKEFEQYMDVIGKIKHPNVVKLRAYYYAKEEKLLVYDYLPNGSLHSLLHGNRGPGRIPLDWTTRISLYPSPTRPRVDEEEQAVDLPKWVRSVVKEEWTAEVFDQELLRYKNIEEELVSMLHVGLACVVPQPEKRPTMAEVTKMIEDIRVEQSPLGEDYDESRNSLSPSLATTEDGMAGY
ncbi:hypothetical protein COLO4_22292 [Corchorus olitorius]|uniref:Protein kinase domain-containing protein n=1 Tax=Corchorus olitorius TaxID=93759 RepID=A0A1R3IN40_9ROSI|nr:hypothetical protein COLO4_22292 [Corchorus olitorius]